MIKLKVEKINVSKAFDRTKIYTPEDITDQVVMPIVDVERLDSTLDTSSLTLVNGDKDAINPFTRMVLTLQNDEEQGWRELQWWRGIINNGRHIWNANGKTYYGGGEANKQLELEAKTYSWNEHLQTAELPAKFYAENIWHDGENTYYSRSDVHLAFDKESGTWKGVVWNGRTFFSGENIWTDGEDIYYSYNISQYVLNRNTQTWEKIEWKGINILDLQGLFGDDVWHDSTNVYYSHGDQQYMLDSTTKEWKKKTWTGLTSFNGKYIWTDDANIYYSAGDGQDYVLNEATSTWNEKTWNWETEKNIINAKHVWNFNGNTYLSSGSPQYVLEKATSTWKKKTWTGLTSFGRGDIWQDGTHAYVGKDKFENQFVLNENTWEPKKFVGEFFIYPFFGEYVWHDGENVYYSSSYMLDKTSNKWKEKGWNIDFRGDDVWTDLTNVYVSNYDKQYILNHATGTWIKKEWKGLTEFYGRDHRIWNDGTNVYYSYGNEQRILNKETGTWEQQTWKGLENFYGSSIWHDGTNVYYSNQLNQFILDKKTQTWERTDWGVITPPYGSYIWTDGRDNFYSYGDQQYVLSEQIEHIYRLVESDTPELLTYGEKPKYRHVLNLIEPTKWLERFDVDNTTITNYLAFLYTDESVIYPQEASYSQKVTDVSGAWVSSVSYGTDRRFYDTVEQGTTINPHIVLDVVYGHYSWGVLVPIGTKNEEAIFTTATMTQPNGEIVQLRGLSRDESMYEWKVDQITFDQLGKYKFTWTYRNGGYIYGTINSWQIQSSYTWEVNVVEASTEQTKAPQRYSIAQVVNLVLQKAGDEATVLRDGIDAPMFQLDSTLTAKLDTITAPEFTFTQNTLFGILSQIGEAINAIPRLMPTNIPTTNILGDFGTDYWTEWNTITFDFLGQPNVVVRGEVTAREQAMRAENYATDFVTNAQNAFQTNNYDYIALTEPYADGFVSTRTEDASFEISNNSACIKTSRPIQRIVELIVYAKYRVEGVDTENARDITKYVKESADYSVLKDYADTSDEVRALGTKEMAIYFTRGSNIIGGLTYTAPTHLSIGALTLSNAITNILRVETGTTSTFELKDLMFRIKYVPFYNLKLKQYKAYIDENSGNNELFYNQQNAQMIDIESLGENMKGALLRTANQEITRTEYFDNFAPIIHAGQLTADGYYAYQVNREITNKRVKTTTNFSKDFNKWNEYVAIKKNYREWEISEKESVETNPTYNEFCIISTAPDWEADKPQRSDYESEEVFESAMNEYNKRLTSYAEYLAKLGGFSSREAMEQIAEKLGNTSGDFKPIDWVVGTTKSEEYTGGAFTPVEHTFLLPCACFSFGNSVVMNFGALDNYAVGTYADTKTVGNNRYALENYVKYTDKYGRAQTLALCFGSGNAKTDGFTTFDNALTSSKEFYNFDKSELNENAIVLDYRDHPFIVNKDSRQALNFTIQLHFVTETERVWLGKGFAQMMSFVGNTEVGGLRFAEFYEKPDKFLSQTLPELSTSTWSERPMPSCTINNAMKTLVLGSTTIKNDCVGVGMVDNQNRCVLFYDKEYKAGDKTDTLYFEFRRKI